MELPGNHKILQVGPVTISCMDSDARDLMDRVKESYRKKVRGAWGRPSVPGFVRWLFKESGLVDDVEEAAVASYTKNMDERRASLKDHPNPKFRRSMSRGSIHGFAYWFFRWSGLVGPDGKAASSK